MRDIVLETVPLTAEAFAPFGDVIETAGRTPLLINDATCERFHDLAPIDALADGGRPLISIFRAQPRRLPLEVKLLERHPLSSQTFCPLDRLPFLVVVAEAGDRPSATAIRAFRASGNQGVSYRRNTWHHALIALGQTSHFLVIDRDGPGENCEAAPVDPAVVVVIRSPHTGVAAPGAAKSMSEE